MNEPDPMLAKLVEAVDRSSLSFAVTLTVSGQRVRGTLISERTWLKRSAEAVRAAQSGDPDSVDSFAEMLEEMHSYRERQKAQLAKLEDLHEAGDLHASVETAYIEYLPRCIHLDEARFSPGLDAPVGGLWRGRLSEVAGWSLGYHGD